MSWLSRLLSSSESNPDDSPDHQRPCNVTGHDWQPAYSPDYFARSATFRDNVMRFKKKTHEKCSKCDDYRSQREWIGKVKIDKETDELTVIR